MRGRVLWSARVLLERRLGLGWVRMLRVVLKRRRIVVRGDGTLLLVLLDGAVGLMGEQWL